MRECRKTEDPLAQVAPCREVLDQCHPTLRRTTDEVLQRGLRELFEEHPVRQRFVDTDIAAADHYYEAIRTLFNAFRKPGGVSLAQSRESKPSAPAPAYVCIAR